MTAPDDNDLALWFTPDAIREHFEGDEDTDIDGMSDEALREVGWLALQSDALYRVFHETLVEALRAQAGEAS